MIIHKNSYIPWTLYYSTIELLRAKLATNSHYVNLACNKNLNFSDFL